MATNDLVVNALVAMGEVLPGSEHRMEISRRALDAILELTGFAAGGVAEVAAGVVELLAHRGDAGAAKELAGRCARMHADQPWMVGVGAETVEIAAYGATLLLGWQSKGICAVAYDSQPQPSDEQMRGAKCICDHLGAVLDHARLRRVHADLVRQTLLGENRDEIGAVTSGLAHHFNNLLGGMLGLVMLAPRLGPEELTELCGRLKNQVEGANELTTNMLEVARAIRQRRADEVSELGSTLRETIALIRPGLPEHVVVDLQIDERPAPAAIAETAFARIVINLVQNAAQAVEPGDGRVWVTLETQGENCVVEVQDNGPGVPIKSSERIFTPYVTLNDLGGAGIGLSTARSLAERALGSLILRRGDGGGARFVLTLPLVS